MMLDIETIRRRCRRHYRHPLGDAGLHHPIVRGSPLDVLFRGLNATIEDIVEMRLIRSTLESKMPRDYGKRSGGSNQLTEIEENVEFDVRREASECKLGFAEQKNEDVEIVDVIANFDEGLGHED
jgi:hypothetical protein